ncbi:hypothetical protein [Burkholderia gladioli]|uniref:hypothetical protein n=1 Tax=Burkholderia gladioli TaxID=28095 RepID=UPI00163F27F3|nr:hypothetical protein [Burkholderia gladioli]
MNGVHKAMPAWAANQTMAWLLHCDSPAAERDCRRAAQSGAADPRSVHHQDRGPRTGDVQIRSKRRKARETGAIPGPGRQVRNTMRAAVTDLADAITDIYLS